MKTPFKMNLATLHSQLSLGLTGKIEAPQYTGLLLAAYTLHKDKTWILAHPEYVISEVDIEVIEGFKMRLLKGEPLPYILNQQEFFGLTFYVSPAVLIPRSETELLVEQALKWLSAHPNKRKALDVGTGSGCIAIALAHTIEDVSVTASDISVGVLKIAQRNAELHQVDYKIQFFHSDLLSEIQGKYDLICANLPYIPTAKLIEVNSLPYEPIDALDGGEDGLFYISKLIAQSILYLKIPGLMLIEIEETTSTAVLDLAHSFFPTALINLHQDLAGKDRLISIELEEHT